MTDLEKRELEELAEKGIQDLRLDITPERANEIAVLFCDRNKFSLTQFQYFYDYVVNKGIFHNTVVMPSGSYISTMTLTEFSRWVQLLNDRLKEFVK